MDEVVEETAHLARVARHVGHALLVAVELLQRAHRQVQVVLLEAERLALEEKIGEGELVIGRPLLRVRVHRLKRRYGKKIEPEDGTFAQRCNLSMVELEAVEEEEELNQRLHHQGGDLHSHGRVDVMGDMTRFDAERLHQLISNHLRYTGSTRAKEILDNWDAFKGKFRKVMPHEFSRALAEMDKARAMQAAE